MLRLLLISAGTSSVCPFSSLQPPWCIICLLVCSAFNFSQKYWSLGLCSHQTSSGPHQCLDLWSEGQTSLRVDSGIPWVVYLVAGECSLKDTCFCLEGKWVEAGWQTFSVVVIASNFSFPSTYLMMFPL